MADFNISGKDKGYYSNILKMDVESEQDKKNDQECKYYFKWLFMLIKVKTQYDESKIIYDS